MVGAEQKIFLKLKTLDPWKWPFQSSINVFLKDQ